MIENGSRFAAMEARFYACLQDAHAYACLKGWTAAMPWITGATLKFNLKGRAAGMARYQRGAYGAQPRLLECRLNPEAYLANPSDMLEDTIPHEVAHLLCMLQGVDRGHGEVWRTTCIALGGSGKRCHDLKLAPARKVSRHRYVASCGTAIDVSAVIHGRIQRGQVRKLVRTGGRVTAAQYQGRVSE